MTAAIYSRVSTRDKGQDTENQFQELRRFAERLGYAVHKKYTDHESGSKAERTQLRQVLIALLQYRAADSSATDASPMSRC